MAKLARSRFVDVGEPEDEDRPSLEAILDHYEIDYRSGRASQMTRCPFHEDKNPSFSLELNKGLFHCHSCGEGGDAYTLVQKKEGIDFSESRTFISALGISAGGVGGGDRTVSAGPFGRTRKVSRGKKVHSGDGSFVPRWRSG